MKPIHVECKPDEALVKKLGFPKRLVTHHSGKSRVFNALSKVSNQLAMVDEDPGSARTTYEKNLHLVKESNGVKCYTDDRQNKVLVLKIKLEDWMIAACKQQNIQLSKYGFKGNASEVHSIINERIESLEKLIDELLNARNPSITTLKDWLQ